MCFDPSLLLIPDGLLMSLPDGIKWFLPSVFPRPCVRAHTRSLQDWAPSAKLLIIQLLLFVDSCQVFFFIACLLPPPKLEHAAVQTWRSLTAAVTPVILV